MASDLVNVGALPNDGTGEALRALVIKYNGNFQRLDADRATLLSSLIVAMIVDDDGHLLVTYADNSTADLGNVSGPVGVASAAVNGAGRLILTRSDGSTIDAGSVIGPTGRGVASATVDASRHLILTYTDGATVDAGFLGAGVSGPTTSAANNIALFNATDGSVLKDSGVKIGTAANNVLQLGSDAKVPNDNLPAAVAAGIIRTNRSSNTQLVAADKGKWYGLTGTFTQTFDTAANLGAGWSVFLDNTGTGQITIPSSDGVTNWIMYPGEIRLFFSDGTSITSKIITPFFATFAASGTFTKPPGYRLFEGMIWGGGASGVNGGGANSAAYGGGGAPGTPLAVLASALAASTSVTIGAGGVGSSATSSASAGGSTFANVIAPGGSNFSGSFASTKGLMSTSFGGASDPYSGGPLSFNTTAQIYAGGTGGGSSSGTVDTAPGTSAFAGAGGVGAVSGTAGAGQAPGGGGGGCYNGTSGSGARGELRIWGVV